MNPNQTPESGLVGPVEMAGQAPQGQVPEAQLPSTELPVLPTPVEAVVQPTVTKIEGVPGAQGTYTVERPSGALTMSGSVVAQEAVDAAATQAATQAGQTLNGPTA